MKNKVLITYGSMITSLGNNVSENYHSLLNGDTGLKIQNDVGFGGEDLPLGKIMSLPSNVRYNELLSRLCSNLILNHGDDLFKLKRTLIIVSSTKADITALPNDTFLSTKNIIYSKLKNPNKIIFISNACISGVLSINLAADYLNNKNYDNVVVIGIDILSDFVVFGFQSLYAHSLDYCKPYNINRSGINLGEAAGALILSKNKFNSDNYYVEHVAGSSSNDANHITGPSRTGEGLVRTVTKSLRSSTFRAADIDFISAHGTATIYNDEMESVAFDRLNMNKTPLNSLKGFFGHTLGAAGVIEVLSCLLMMENNIVFKSAGIEENTLGVSRDINVLTKNESKQLDVILKTASGFGGGNASLILQQA